MNGKSPHAPSDRQLGWWGVKASEAASSLALGHLEVLIKCLPPAFRVVTRPVSTEGAMTFCGNLQYLECLTYLHLMLQNLLRCKMGSFQDLC